MPSKDTKLSDKDFERIGRALAEPRRVDILRQVGEANGEIRCRALDIKPKVSAATMSHHIKELETAGLVETEKDGKFMCITLNRRVLKAYLDRLAKI
jgi:ArsR family transcriptional regulator